MPGLKRHSRYAAIRAFSGAAGIALRRLTALGATRLRSSEEVPPSGMPLSIARGGHDIFLAHGRDFVKLLAEGKISHEHRELSPRVHSWDDHIRVFLDRLSYLEGWS